MAEEKQDYEGTAHEADLTVGTAGGNELNWDLPVMGGADAASSSGLDDTSATASANDAILGNYPDFHSSADLPSGDMSPHSFEADLGNLSEDLSSAGHLISEDLSSAGDDLMSEDLASAGDEISTEDPVSGGDEPVEL